MAELGALYNWLMAAHIIFVVYWMAGLLILPRYLVYHQEALAAERADEAVLWAKRESSLRLMILTPALVLVWVLGLSLATIGHHWAEPWLHAKLLLVVLMAGYHGWAVGYARKLGRGRANLSGKRLRLINEVPALLLVPIVILVVIKPFGASLT